MTPNEKITLIVLVVCTLIIIIITINLSINTTDPPINHRIHIIQTGGKVENDFEHKIKQYQGEIGAFDVHQFPINSSAITATDMNSLSDYIASVYNSYDAFVIIYPSNTLAYASSILSFTLENLDKPVVFTDGDVIKAIKHASHTPVPEVMVSSQGELLRATRSVPFADSYFISPNYPSINFSTGLSMPTEPFQIRHLNEAMHIGVVQMFPGIETSQYMKNIVSDNAFNGIILELYGDGDYYLNDSFLNMLKDLINRGIIIVTVSQYDYKTIAENPSFTDIGILYGYDMTTYAAYAKLWFIISNIQDMKLVPALMKTNFKGEMS